MLLHLTPLLAGLLSLSPPGEPRALAPAAISVQESRLEEAPRARRVLHLSTGELLRGASERAGRRWRVRVDGRWRELPAGEVVRVRLESELLREARELAEPLEPADPRIVELVRWMVGEGLFQEALLRLDPLLDARPDDAAALELLASGRLGRLRIDRSPEARESERDRLLTLGAHSDRAERELVIHALRSLEGSESEGASVSCPATGKELELALLAALRSHRPGRRSFAAQALRRLAPGAHLEPLLGRCALDPEPGVRREAALGLGIADDDGAILPLVRALGSDSRAVRSNAAESLGHAGRGSAVPALVHQLVQLPPSGGSPPPPVTAHLAVGRHLAYLQDFDVELAQGGAIADPRVRAASEGVVLDVRLGGISSLTLAREQRVLVRALEQLTGAQPGSSKSDWQDWYREHGQRYQPVAGDGPGAGPR